MSESSEAHPTVLPDYYSDENWNKFISYLPDYQREQAPSYCDAAKSLDEHEAELHRQGFNTIRVQVNATEWIRWVKTNDKLISRETATEFAMQKYVDHINRGLDN